MTREVSGRTLSTALVATTPIVVFPPDRAVAERAATGGAASTSASRGIPCDGGAWPPNSPPCSNGQAQKQPEPGITTLPSGLTAIERADLEAIVAHDRDAAESALQATGLGTGAGADISQCEIAGPANRLCRGEGGPSENAIGWLGAPILVPTIEQVEENGGRDDRHAGGA